MPSLLHRFAHRINSQLHPQLHRSTAASTHCMHLTMASSLSSLRCCCRRCSNNGSVRHDPVLGKPVTYRLMFAGHMDENFALGKRGGDLKDHWDTLRPIGEDGPWSASQSPEVRRKHDESSSQGSDEEESEAKEDSSSNCSSLDAQEKETRRKQYAAEAMEDASKAIQDASGVKVLEDYYLETAMNLVCSETAEDGLRVCIGTFWGLAQGPYC